MVLILTARMWECVCSPAPRLASPPGSSSRLRHRPAACCLYVFTRTNVTLQTGSMLAEVFWGATRAPWQQAALQERTDFFISSDMRKALRGKQKFSSADTFAYPLLGRCRSMGKQDCGLCTPQSDGFKGHDSNAHTQQRWKWLQVWWCHAGW